MLGGLQDHGNVYGRILNKERIQLVYACDFLITIILVIPKIPSMTVRQEIEELCNPYIDKLSALC